MFLDWKGGANSYSCHGEDGLPRVQVTVSAGQTEGEQRQAQRNSGRVEQWPRLA